MSETSSLTIPDRRRLGRALMAWGLALVLALAWDRAAWLSMACRGIEGAAARQRLESRDWYKALRICGSLQTWLVIGVIFVLIDSGRIGGGVRRWGRRGAMLVLCAGASGIAAELLKVVFGRVRPEAADGRWRVYGVVERFRDVSFSDLSLPSSHAAVAFGAAFALSAMYPRARWVFFAIAAGCGVTRIAIGEHFVSDIVFAAFVAWGVTGWLLRMDRRNNEGRGLHVAA